MKRGEAGRSNAAVITPLLRTIIDCRSGYHCFRLRTLYPFVREKIGAVAKQVKRVLKDNALLNGCRQHPHVRFWSHSSHANMPTVIERLWGIDEMQVIVELIDP